MTETPAGEGRAEQVAPATPVRGSALLLAGRLIATGVNFVTQVLLVRTLSKDGFGVLAFALSLVNVAETAMLLGLDRAVTRFAPIYDEHGDDDRLRGVLVLVMRLVTALGLVLVAAGLLLGPRRLGSLVGQPAAGRLLAVLVLLAPIQAVDTLLLGLFAVFASPRAIFVRRYVLGPGLRLAVVAWVLFSGQDEHAVAVGYVAAAAAGAALYVVVLVRWWQRTGVLARLRRAKSNVPVRAVLAFSLPLFSSDLVFIALESVDVLLLARYGTAEDLASLRAVLPVARVNQLVLASFGVLYTPAAARLFARRDYEGVGALYWSQAAWVAVLTFPAALVSFALAPAVTVALFGSRYATAAPLLTILAAGWFLNAALGFNGLTLNVFGRVRAVVAVNIGAALANVALGVVLIPRFGAVGAATSTALTLVLHNCARQLALQRTTGIAAINPAYLGTYARLISALIALAVLQRLADPPLAVGLALAAALALLVLRWEAHRLDLASAFPELARIRPLARLLGVRPTDARRG